MQSAGRVGRAQSLSPGRVWRLFTRKIRLDDRFPLIMEAFGLVELDGRDLRLESLAVRRRLLARPGAETAFGAGAQRAISSRTGYCSSSTPVPLVVRGLCPSESGRAIAQAVPGIG